MKWLQGFFLAMFCSLQLGFQPSGEALECRGNSGNGHRISLSVNSARSSEDEWKTSFIARQNSSHQPRSIDVNVTRSYETCEGNHHLVQVAGFLRDIPQEQKHSSLIFKRCSNNAAVTNNGRTMQKLKLDEPYGSCFTNRPLLDDEIFTVRIDAKEGDKDWGPGIGLTTLTLDGQELQEHSHNYKSGTWLFYGTYFHQNGTTLNSNYPKKHLKEAKNVGVMRSRFGAIHVFVDGVDQGPAASNIPSNVYGVFELYSNVKKATIIDL